MTIVSQDERRHLELAFESSYAIVKLAGLEGDGKLTELRKRIIEGELTYDEAVQTVLTGPTHELERCLAAVKANVEMLSPRTWGG